MLPSSLLTGLPGQRARAVVKIYWARNTTGMTSVIKRYEALIFNIWFINCIYRRIDKISLVSFSVHWNYWNRSFPRVQHFKELLRPYNFPIHDFPFPLHLFSFLCRVVRQNGIVAWVLAPIMSSKAKKSAAATPAKEKAEKAEKVEKVVATVQKNIEEEDLSGISTVINPFLHLFCDISDRSLSLFFQKYRC